MTVGSERTRERPRPFADDWAAPGTPTPPTTISNTLAPTSGDEPPLTADEVAAARGVDRSGGIHLSPDGTEVAFAWEREGALDRSGALEIYTAPIFGERIIQLTDADGRSTAPRWSPDGRWIAFIRDGRVWVVDRDGEHEHALTSDDRLRDLTVGPDGAPQWSLNTAPLVLVAAGIDQVANSARWSPDGTTIAFTTRAQGKSAIAFAEIRDGKVRRVEIHGSTPFDDTDPVWRPDARGVVYRRHERGRVTLRRAFTVSHADEAVLDVPGWLFSPQVGRDSETVVAVLVDRRGADVVVRPKGGIAVARITRSGAG